MFPPVQQAAALVIEDDALIAWAVENVVRDCGFAQVIVASTAESAMQAAAAAQLGLIVCDLNLGPLTVDGLQLLELIDPDEAVPTVIYTAYSVPEIERAMRERRPRASCLIKPTSDHVLAQTIREVLANPLTTGRFPSLRTEEPLELPQPDRSSDAIYSNSTR